SLICTIVDPITREPYDRDPRGLAEKAEAYLKSTGIADTAFFGPEAEFFIFDDVRFSYGANSSFHCLESGEGHWNSAREEFPNLGYKIRAKEGYFPVAPADTLQDIRNEMCLELEKAGVPIDKPLFAGNGYAGLSDTALFFVGGILKHAPALTCFTNPTTNSYKRLVPGFEAPVNLAYSARNRSAAIRIPTYSASPKSKRIEFR